MSESEFITEIAERSGSGILLDLNNIYINAFNLGVDTELYLKEVPVDLVGEMHLAGGEKKGDLIIDSHNCPIWDEVWELYERAIKRFGSTPTLIEWDNDLPEFETLEKEAEKAAEIINSNSDIALTGIAEGIRA